MFVLVWFSWCVFFKQSQDVFECQPDIPTFQIYVCAMRLTDIILTYQNIQMCSHQSTASMDVRQKANRYACHHVHSSSWDENDIPLGAVSQALS